jgi:opacity protein-like surface antigen
MNKWLAAIALVAPVSVLAGDNSTGGFYVGGGVSEAKLSFPGNGGEVYDWVTAEVLAGYKHSPFVGGEARVGFASERIDVVYTSLYYRTESSNDTAKTYLLFGYTFGQTMFDADPGVDDHSTLSGFSYGAGVGFPIGTKLNVNFEYRMILDGKDKYEGDSIDAELKGFSINVDYRF